MSQCKKFISNIFHKSKCSNCFRQKEEHSAEALESNRASRSVARSGYLFVAPDWDFSVPLNRTKRWQRRYFVLYDDGELTYAVDEHPDTVPQGSVAMSTVLEVTGAEQITGHPHSVALTSPDHVTFIKATNRDDARLWAEVLAVFPRRPKRNATFPGGRASPSLPQFGRSASPQPPRSRLLNVSGASPRANFETPPLKEERGLNANVSYKDKQSRALKIPHTRPVWVPEEILGVAIEDPISGSYREHTISSGSPPTRDKLQGNDKVKVRLDWRHERLRDIATALTDRSLESSLTLPSEGLLNRKKGWLWIKSSDNDWVRRWVVLCSPLLNIYIEQDTATPEISKELSDITSYTELPTEAHSKYALEIQWPNHILTLGAVTQSTRSSWVQALKRVVPMEALISVSESASSQSFALSSDEEYKTASEGGRRESGDWNEVPSSQFITLVSLKAKDRSRLRLRPRSQSRQSTLDSTSTDELDCVKEWPITNVDKRNHTDQNNSVISALQNKLQKSTHEIACLEEEILRLKKLQSEATLREKQAKETLKIFEKNEQELNQRNSEVENKFIKEQKILQKRLMEAEEVSRTFEKKYGILLQMLASLQDEVASSNNKLEINRKENESLHKKLQEFDKTYYLKTRDIKFNSLADLTNVDLETDIDALGTDKLKEFCLDLKCRFERAVIEIITIKKEFQTIGRNFDSLEITNYALKQSIELINNEHQAEVNLLVARLDHLTSKLNTVEKQLRTKVRSEGRDKRRSLSLKGREYFCINKELEVKVTELEAKILSLEKGQSKTTYKRDKSNERSSPVDDKTRRRFRRKSLESATSLEPLELIMRLSNLETKVACTTMSTEYLNALGNTSDLIKLTEKHSDLDHILFSAKSKVVECMHSVKLLKSKRTSLSSDRLMFLENTLKELNDILNIETKDYVNPIETRIINSSTESTVKQLEKILVEKLTRLAEKKKKLYGKGLLDTHTRLQILAEKISYENILVDRIQKALRSPISGEPVCKRLIDKETRETAYLIMDLQNKLNGVGSNQPPVCRTGVEYLSKVLAKYLMAGKRIGEYINVVQNNGPTLNILLDEQQKLDVMLDIYKATKLPQLADALANKAYNMSKLDTSQLNKETTEEFTRMAENVVNTELIQSEINHVLLRAAHIYKSNLEADHTFFFSFFASERAALELWSDSVENSLYNEINKCIMELTMNFRTSFEKLQKQNWKQKTDIKQSNTTVTSLLQDVADVIAHKALIDARISVLSGKCNIPIENTVKIENSILSNWLEQEKCSIHLENQSIIHINPNLELEFSCMLDQFSQQCLAGLEQLKLAQVTKYLTEFQVKIQEFQRRLEVPMLERFPLINNWSDVCQICKILGNELGKIEDVIEKLVSTNNLNQRPVSFTTEYLTHVENLRTAFRFALTSCKDLQQESAIEQLQQLCERVLISFEQWHQRAIQDLREAHALEVNVLKQEKEQALEEETQATLSALDAMKKAHLAEVEREIEKFKMKFTREQNNEIIDLSKRLSVKSMEAAALEEQLGCATRQLADAQQYILKLEKDPQFSSLMV